MKQIPNIEELKTEFTKWHTAETTFAYGIPDDETIADWWLEKLHHQLQKARAEMLHKLHLCAIGKYEGDALENVKAQIAEYHSELDQDKK